MSQHDFDVRLGLSYSLGAYLAVNALPDSLLVMDGMDCTVQMASQIQGNHDWHANLVSSDGAHRIVTTHAMPEEIWKSREEDIARVVTYAIGRTEVRAVFLGALRMASITEPAYDLILDTCAEQTGTDKVLMVLPTRSMVDDWLTGYADAMACLARSLPLDAREREPGRRVVVVGYLMDRNEEDHLGNLRELTRLIEGIGGELVCTWFSGEPTSRLQAAGRADVVVSLPYGRAAAEVLAARTGAKLVETDLPMGLDGTRAWLMRIAEALEVQEQAQAFIDGELAVAASKLEWVVQMVSRDLSVAVMGDPHLVRGFLGLARELGIRVPLRALVCSPSDDLGDLTGGDVLDDPEVIVDPREGQLKEPLERAIEQRGVNLVIGTSYVLQDALPPVACFELGFPSFHSHALTDQPFLGFRGCLSLVARLAERRAWQQLLRDPRPVPSNG